MGSEMCIRDSYLSIHSFMVFPGKVLLCSLGCPGTHSVDQAGLELRDLPASASQVCLLYTSDAADDMQCVDLGGRRIIKKIFFKQKTAYEM